jgi:hypothetical protein
MVSLRSYARRKTICCNADSGELVSRHLRQHRQHGRRCDEKHVFRRGHFHIQDGADAAERFVDAQCLEEGLRATQAASDGTAIFGPACGVGKSIIATALRKKRLLAGRFPPR